MQSLVDQCRNGKRAESGYKKEAWIVVLEDVKAAASSKTSVDLELVTLSKIKSKQDFIKGKWKEWVRINELSGWGWNEDTQLFIAEPDQWERHIKV